MHGGGLQVKHERTRLQAVQRRVQNPIHTRKKLGLEVRGVRKSLVKHSDQSALSLRVSAAIRVRGVFTGQEWCRLSSKVFAAFLVESARKPFCLSVTLDASDFSRRRKCYE